MSNIIDSIKLSGTVYTLSAQTGGVTVDPSLDSGSTNPVQNKALYDELRLNVTEQTETLLQWEQYDGGESTNYPIGCTKITVEVDENEMTYGAYTLYNNNYDCFGVFVIESNGGVITVSTTDCQSEPATNITYSISENVVTIEYPTITNVTIIGTSYDNYWTIKAISETSTVTPLIDQVTANTVSISGKQDTLISGTNIKTINNESILGSGNITIQGGGNPTVELTQAEYDALVTAGTVSADTYYIITDAQAGDLTNYYTKSETNTLLGGKADTATTYTKTEVDNAITAAINDKASKSQAYGGIYYGTSSGKEYVLFEKVNGTRDTERYISKINGYPVWGTTNANACKNWELVETSAITTSITSSSTDVQVPSAKAVNDKLGGLSLVKLTQSAYDALSPNYDSNTLYIIKD